MSGLIFEPTRGILRRGDEVIRLTDSERELLTILADHRGEAVGRQTLASSGLERSIDVQVTRVRKKIEPNPKEPIHLQTVRGKGYRLMPD